MSKGVVRFSISIPHDLMDVFEKFVKELRYKRSRAVQEAIRMFINEHSWKYKEGEYVYGTINILYDHEVRGLEESLTDIQHSYMDVISSALHLHVDERNCMLVIIIRGESSRVKKLINDITGKRGVKQLKTIVFTSEGLAIKNAVD
ncbi:MAG: nickel-responsive transcriptional regulator NikR [Sulfolobales archaeon]